MVVAVFLIAECTEFWHFVLCQGVVIGVRALPRRAAFRVVADAAVDRP
jgi:hypothetical protein